MTETMLLTGLPRSGTTLVCNLLNSLPDCVALAEPIVFGSSDSSSALREISSFSVETRQSLLSNGKAYSFNVAGEVPDNWLEEPILGEARKRKQVQRSEIEVRKELAPGFKLIVKHPAEFTALADAIVREYPLVALVRHPLSVLAAWQVVDMPIREGRLPLAERFNRELASHLDGIADRIERQIFVLRWMLNRYASNAKIKTIRYEDMISEPAHVLGEAFSISASFKRAPKKFELTDRYPGVDMSLLAHRLIAIKEIANAFYPRFEESLSSYR